MTYLKQSIYNQRLRRDQKKLKIWRYAGIMLTYKCNASCEFCYYHCRPDKNGLIEIDTAINAWLSLKTMAGKDAKIHITGGEAFLYFDHLIQLLKAARLEKLTGAMIETNGFWATNKKIVKERLSLLKDAGIGILKISYDPFHAEYVDYKSVRCLADMAIEILGSENVKVRWEKYLQSPVKMTDIQDIERLEIYRSTINDYPVMFTGRAGGKLAALFANKKIEELENLNCQNAFLASKGIHIDPEGNVFNGQCSGIIIGNVKTQKLEEIWKIYDPENMPYISSLFHKGPVGMLPEAVASGYKPLKHYAGKCHLCSNLRQFFFDKGLFKKIIGPIGCYADPAGS